MNITTLFEQYGLDSSENVLDALKKSADLLPNAMIFEIIPTSSGQFKADLSTGVSRASELLPEKWFELNNIIFHPNSNFPDDLKKLFETWKESEKPSLYDVFGLEYDFSDNQDGTCIPNAFYSLKAESPYRQPDYEINSKILRAANVPEESIDTATNLMKNFESNTDQKWKDSYYVGIMFARPLRAVRIVTPAVLSSHFIRILGSYFPSNYLESIIINMNGLGLENVPCRLCIDIVNGKVYKRLGLEFGQTPNGQFPNRETVKNVMQKHCKYRINAKIEENLNNWAETIKLVNYLGGTIHQRISSTKDSTYFNHLKVQFEDNLEINSKIYIRLSNCNREKFKFSIIS
jgi:hypothetical protein